MRPTARSRRAGAVAVGRATPTGGTAPVAVRSRRRPETPVNKQTRSKAIRADANSARPVTVKLLRSNAGMQQVFNKSETGF